MQLDRSWELDGIEVLRVSGSLPVNEKELMDWLQLKPELHSVIDLRETANMPVFELTSYLNSHALAKAKFKKSILVVVPEKTIRIFGNRSLAMPFTLYTDLENALKDLGQR